MTQTQHKIVILETDQERRDTLKSMVSEWGHKPFLFEKASRCLDNLEPLAPDLPSLLDYLREHTGVDDWIGSVGCGICTTGREIYDEPAAAVMLISLPENSYRLLPSGIDSMTDMVSANRNWIAKQGVHFGIVHGDPRNSHIPQLIESLSAELDPGFLVGGLTSADDDNYLLQISGDVCQGGISGVLISAEVPVISGVTQGCTPLPNKHVITRCDGNLLAELDGRPALDVFKEDIGEVLSKDLSRVAGYIFAGLPIAEAVFARVEPGLRFIYHAQDGNRVKRQQIVAEVIGPGRGMLAAERTVRSVSHVAEMRSAARR